MSTCSLDPFAFDEEQHRKSLRRRSSQALASGKKDGERWAKGQATAKQLQRLENLHEQCERTSRDSWPRSFADIYSTQGPKAVSDNLACLMIGDSLDEDFANEFWERVYPDGVSPYLYHWESFVRGFAEGALKVWGTPAGKKAARRRRAQAFGKRRSTKSKFILCVDQSKYCGVLHAALLRDGGRVIQADWDNAARKLASKNCDVAIFDVRAYPPSSESYESISEMFPDLAARFLQPPSPDEPTPDRYGVIREISESEWGRTHPVVVYSYLPEEEFRQIAVANGIDLARVRYYCKALRQIPPELECIRQAIIERPDYIGFYFSDKDTPKAITQDLIDSEPAVYPLIGLYLSKLMKRARPRDDLHYLAKLPRGYRMVFLFGRFVSDVDNGGFGQFLGNAFAVHDSGQAIIDTVEDLERFGLNQLADMAREAVRISAARLPASVVSAVGRRTRRKASFKSRLPVHGRDKIDRQLDALDAEFNAMDYCWGADLVRYVKEHPEDFIHPQSNRKAR
jgi:hypothetical protein